MDRTDSLSSPVKMVNRIAFILHTLSARSVEGITVTELVGLLDLRKPTAHRLLSALVDVGFLYQDINTKRYRLGSAVTQLGQSAIEQVIGGSARHILAQLAAETEDTVFASIREGAAAICVARETGSFPIRTLTLDVGDRRPLGVGAGSLAILAFLDDDDIENTLARNKRWLADFEHFPAEDILALVARTRRDGFALNTGRIVPGMNAIGVPVRGQNGAVVASISLAAIKDRMGPDRVPELVTRLKMAAEELSGIISIPPRPPKLSSRPPEAGGPVEKGLGNDVPS